MEAKTLFLILFVVIWKVESVHIEGPPLTRYRPCLGLLYFDQLANSSWTGFIDMGQYKNYEMVDAVISFREEFALKSNNSVMMRSTDNKKTLIMHAEQPIPETISFVVRVDSEVPAITNFTLDDTVMCDEGIEEFQFTEYPSYEYSQDCGNKSPQNEKLISLRAEAKAGDWPWHVAVLLRNMYHCGGTIVSKTAVITAAFCLRNADTKDITILAGVTRVPLSGPGFNQTGEQKLKATELIVHEKYSGDPDNSDDYNLAIIKVNSFEFTNYVKPICVFSPEKTSLFSKEAIVVGFGTRTTNIIPKSIDTMIQNHNKCRDLYETRLNEFTFCAGFGPESSLNAIEGDGGSGLVVSRIGFDQTNTWFLRGVNAMCYPSCDSQCNPKKYSLYADIVPYYSWIYEHAGL